MILARFNPDAPPERLIDLLLTILQPVFWGALCLGFVFAGAHFLTMLATRWGERRVSSKALFFSLAVHLSMGCGVIALIPEYRQRLLRFIERPEQEPIQIQTVVYESEHATPERQAGNTPIWDQLAKTEIEDLTRFEKTVQTFQPDAAPEPKPEEVKLEQRVLPDVDMIPERPATVPSQERPVTEGVEQQAVVPLQVESPELMVNDDLSVPSATRQRAQVEVPAAEEETSPRDLRKGTVDRPREDYAPIPDVASIRAREQQIAQLERRTNDTIRRREGPAPAQADREEIGQSPKAARGEEPIPAPQGPTRSDRQRPIESRNETLPARQRSELTPRSPDPLDSGPLASLDGKRQRNPELPNVQRQNFDPLHRDDLVKVPAAYQMRAVDRRELAARQFGGTEESEEAVELALKWMASVQHSDGYWDASRYGAGSAPEREQDHERPNAGADADTGVTALAVLAFLGAGHTTENGEYAPHVRRALQWLVNQQAANGYLGSRASYVAGNYCHGMATFALAEAYALRGDSASGRWLRDPVAKAVDFIVSQQTPDGSWRYVFVDNTYGDMSMFGWQFMALKSAEAGGVQVPEETKRRMTKFLVDMSRGRSGGLSAYRAADRESAPMTAEALFCKQMLGLDRSHASSDEATRYLIRHLPNRPQMNLYYWYYGTLAMFQYGGQRWQTWNEALRDLLVADQIRNGSMAGTWDPRGDEWGLHGGRIYSTAMATLCLEVYYRYLPLYKMGGRYEAEEP